MNNLKVSNSVSSVHSVARCAKSLPKDLVQIMLSKVCTCRLRSNICISQIEMVEKFREITMSVAADSSLDTGNNIEEKVICYSCSRKTSVNEMFLCKNCKVQNKSTKKVILIYGINGWLIDILKNNSALYVQSLCY